MKGHQFSLRTLLAAVAAVGIGAALWTAEPSWQVGAVEFILVAWILASALTMIVHAAGRAKAFWFGVGIQCALPIACLMSGGTFSEDKVFGFTYFEMTLGNLSDSFRPVLLAWAFAPIVGLLCVLTHWVLVRPASAEPKEEPMTQSESTAANLDRRSRRRWLQFSLRGFLVVLTISCLWLGWKVEIARKRGRAIDAIIEAGNIGGYGDSGDDPFLPRGRSVADHFWLDLKGVPVILAIDTHLNATLASHLSKVYALKELDILIPPTDQEVRHLEGVQGKCKIRFYNTNGRSHAALEELQRKLPEAIIVWGNEE